MVLTLTSWGIGSAILGYYQFVILKLLSISQFMLMTEACGLFVSVI